LPVVRAIDGEVTALLYLPWIADLPPGWRHFSTAQKERTVNRPRSLLSRVGVKARLAAVTEQQQNRYRK